MVYRYIPVGIWPEYVDGSIRLLKGLSSCPSCAALVYLHEPCRQRPQTLAGLNAPAAHGWLLRQAGSKGRHTRRVRWPAEAVSLHMVQRLEPRSRAAHAGWMHLLAACLGAVHRHCRCDCCNRPALTVDTTGFCCRAAQHTRPPAVSQSRRHCQDSGTLVLGVCTDVEPETGVWLVSTNTRRQCLPYGPFWG